MTAVINYDRPVANYIDQLSATGHVTHTAYRKASVTFHHNAGRLSLQGILDVWKTRPASAHFQVDGAGHVGQYVKVNEYAWATGSTQGNKESISIELANATLAPNWTVAKATYEEGARLCGWIHANILGVRPSRKTVKMHKDWKATGCPGPFIEKLLNTLISLAQKAYDVFTKKPPAKPAPKPALKPLATIVQEVIDGKWATGNTRVNKLRAAGYDPAKVQAAVNARLKPTTPPRKTMAVIVQEVIDGKWGNGYERVSRLRGLGYDPRAVQAAVNAKLRN
jgi:hypothetical protein